VARAAEPEALAVLPFRVHSAKPIGYLGDSLANLMRARLEASGKVRGVEPARLASLRPEAVPGDDAGLRRLAAELGAAWVVTGSLTELAGRYSLDVRLTPAEAALPSHSEVGTSEREDQLLAVVDELADRLLAELGAATPARIARVEFAGIEGATRYFGPKLATRAGEPYDPAVVRADLERLRAEPGVASAELETERSAEGVVVRFRLVGAASIYAPPGAAAHAAGERVVEVRVRGNRRIETDAILLRVRTKPGSPTSDAQLAKDLRSLHELGFFRDVRVFSERTAEGRIVTFEVEESPIVREISISGNDNVEGDKIRDILTLTTGSSLDYPLLAENRGRVQALYRAEGYYLAEVSYEIEPLTEAAVGIHFKVEEGEKLKLREIDFEGNEFFDDGELREGFQTRIWHFWSYATSWFDHSGTYSEPLFAQDLRKARQKYADAGFLQVQVGEPNVIPEPDGLRVKVPVTEGRRFKVGNLDVAGDETVDFDKLRKLLKLETGAWFNQAYLTDDVTQLRDYYRDRGFYFANVQPLTNLTGATDGVDVTFQVQQGPLYFIRQIDLSGNTVTVDPVIRREIPIVEGELYSQRKVLLAKDRIERLGFFEEVDLKPAPTEEPDQIDLDVAVVERPTGSFSFGAGFSSQDKFVVDGSLAQSNLFGRGYAANLTAQFGGRTQRFFLSLRDPSFLDSDYGIGVTAFRTDVRFEDFDQEQTGADFFVSHELSEDGRTNGTVRYGFADRKIEEPGLFQAASLILRELVSGSLTSSSIGLSVTRDMRNDRLAPTAGYVFSSGIDYAGLGFDANYLRMEARGAWFLGAPSWLFRHSSFVVSSRIGYAAPFNTIGDFDLPSFSPFRTVDGNLRPLTEIDTDLELPLSERYFLGGLGAFQLRGFKSRSVGPRRAILQNAVFAFAPGVTVTDLYTPYGRQVVLRDPADPNPPPVEPNPFGDLEPTSNNNLTTVCVFGPGLCNDIDDDDIDDFEDLEATDVIGGNKFISSSFEYRFPISQTIGLQGVVFIDIGNAFEEGRNLFDVTEWRYGTGAGVQWFSPFGPLALVLGFPLDRLSVEKSPVFEFSVGGGAF
jgi:outer membrane protein insertion porin family